MAWYRAYILLFSLGLFYQTPFKAMQNPLVRLSDNPGALNSKNNSESVLPQEPSSPFSMEDLLPLAPAPYLLQIRIRPCCSPSSQSHELEQLKNKALSDSCIPGKMAKKCLKICYFKQYAMDGFVFAYKGMLGITDTNGIVSFALETPIDTIPLIITPTLYPVSNRPGLVNHWNIPVDTPYIGRIFTYKCTENATPCSWFITQYNNHKIPEDALILMANPSNFIISDHSETANRSIHRILPDICLTKPIDKSYALMKTIKYWQHFSFPPTMQRLKDSSIQSFGLYTPPAVTK